MFHALIFERVEQCVKTSNVPRVRFSARGTLLVFTLKIVSKKLKKITGYDSEGDERFGQARAHPKTTLRRQGRGEGGSSAGIINFLKNDAIPENKI